MKHLLILTLLLTELGLAQQLVTIKGPEHPELIPDQAAAIAVFGVHSDTTNAANTEKHHTKLRLSADDHAIYDGAMATLRSHPKDRASTYDYLLERLSPDGQAKLKAFIQSEKPHMQYQIHPPLPEGREDFVVDVGGTWTIYYTQNFASHDDLSITITPQVSISGDDGGYCPAQSGFYGFDTPSVMLHGNAWQVGPSFVSGGQSGGGEPVQFVYTFPDVTLPAAGEPVDLSFASHVEGICRGKNPPDESQWKGRFPPPGSRARSTASGAIGENSPSH